MHRRLVAVIAVLVLGLATTACSSKNDNKSSSGGTTTTNAAAVTTSTSTTQPSGPAATAQAAADGLYNAWVHNDQSDASRYAKPPAISKLFAHPYTAGGATYTRQPCEPQGGQFICSWTYEGGAMQMTVENWPGGGYVVDSVTFIAD